MEILIAVSVVCCSLLILLLVRNYKARGVADSHFKALLQELHMLEVQKATMQEKQINMQDTVNELKYTIDQQRDELISLRTGSTIDKSVISSLETKLYEQQTGFREKLELLEENEGKLKVEFTNLANDILDKNSKKLQQESEKGIGNLLNPMKIQLADFKKKVEDVYDKEAKERNALQFELKSLKELNLKMSADANNLTNALKGQNKQQGVWGEMILEKVLESSGLREGHEYNREVHLKDEDNKAYRPDVVVNLPEDRHIIVDAKTSLVAYNNYMSEEDESEKAVHIRSHVYSMKEHIKGLSEKKYEDLQGVNSLDFIFMFVPIEGALMLALENDVNLYDESFKQKIILVSPTTLLVALRAVENTWRYEKQAQSITEVASRAEKLYEKFTGFVDNFVKMGEQLKKADKSYEDAFKQLKSGSGNLIMQATELKKAANIKPKKALEKSLVEEAFLE